jgi:long-chain fatty acid transport protein
MKKFSLLLTLAVLMVSSSVFAGSIDYLSNQSAKYLMTLAGRAAATDGADIVSYNPAGTALMGEGFFIDVSNQTLFKPYSQDVEFDGSVYDLSKETYEQSTPTILLPNVYLVYNAGQIGMGKLAVFGQAGVVAGGGSLEWSDGTAGLEAAAILVGSSSSSVLRNLDAKVKGSSVYYAFGGGVAYSFLMI